MSAPDLTPYDEVIDVMEHLPLILREARRRKGASLRRVARECDLSFSTVSRIESESDCALSNALAVLRWVAA